MAEVTVTKALTGYFNTGEGKRPSRDWLAELKELTLAEKRDLALQVCAVTGDTLS